MQGYRKLLLAALALCLTLFGAGCANGAPYAGQPPLAQTPVSPKAEAAVDPVAQTAYDYFEHLPEDAHVLPSAALLSLLEAGRGGEVFILDTRTQDLYDAGHIAGAVHMDFGEELFTGFDRIPDDKRIVTICIGGGNDAMAASLLKMAGRDAVSLEGGMVGQGGFEKLPGSEAFMSAEPEPPLPEPIYPVSELGEQIAKRFLEEYEDSLGRFPGFYMFNAQVSEAMGQPGIALIDLRAPEDYATGHLQGAVNIPFGQGVQQGVIDKVNKDDVVILTSWHGQQSAHLVPALRLMGYDAYTLFFGVGREDPNTSEPNSWVREGYALVTN